MGGGTGDFAEAPRRVLGAACGKDGAKLHRGGAMASRFAKLSKWLLISGGAMMALGLIIGLAVASTGGSLVSAQASPTARPATPTVAATPARTATPAAPAASA